MRRRTLAATIALLSVINAYLYAAIFSTPIVQVDNLAAGEARLIRLPGGKNILLGAGPDASVVRALGEALPPWERQVGVLVLLSTDAAQAGGAPFVLTRYGVRQLIRPAERGSRSNETALAAATAAMGATTTNIPPLGRVVLRYGAFTLTLASSTQAGVYALH